jgi:predicted DNA-binding protein
MGSATSHSRQNTKVTSIRFTPDEYEDLKRIAAADKRSLANEVRYLIACRLDELELERAA